MRSCASRRQGKGAIAGSQWRLTERRIAGHGSVMSAETRGIWLVGGFGTIGSMVRDGKVLQLLQCGMMEEDVCKQYR